MEEKVPQREVKTYAGIRELYGINPEIDQDRVKDLYDDFCQRGEVMFRQQRQIYAHLGQRIQGRVIEVGCGVGLGSAMMVQEASHGSVSEFFATDKLSRNVQMAQQLYPWIDFLRLDLGEALEYWTADHYDHLVAVEVFEHVADPRQAVANMLALLKTGGTAWISTPNGKGKERPPSNPFHVCEYTTREMLDLLGYQEREVTILSWQDFSRQGIDTDVSPLVYKVVK